MLTSDLPMSIRFPRDCDGDGQCEFYSVEFLLRAKCISDQTLDVTSKDLYTADHTVVPMTPPAMNPATKELRRSIVNE